jgi:hypothetical protein
MSEKQKAAEKPAYNEELRWKAMDTIFTELLDFQKTLQFQQKLDLSLILADLGNWFTADCLSWQEEQGVYQHIIAEAMRNAK